MSLREDKNEHDNVMSLVSDACKIWEEVTGPDGKPYKELIIDQKRAHLKTLDVASNQFGYSVLTVEQLENLASACFDHMSAPRAVEIAKRIKENCAPYRYSWDAKSSESQRDPNNAKMTFIDKMNKNKSEHVYSMKGEASRSFKDMILGRKVEQDAEKD